MASKQTQKTQQQSQAQAQVSKQKAAEAEAEKIKEYIAKQVLRFPLVSSDVCLSISFQYPLF
jgi:hypothetical protein